MLFTPFLAIFLLHDIVINKSNDLLVKIKTVRLTIAALQQEM